MYSSNQADREPEGTFNFVEILSAAQQAAGLDDFGSGDFLPHFKVYVDMANRAPLTPHGREQQLAAMQRWLVNRLRFADAAKRHPDILREDVSDPIVVLGFPRSGTTVLQRMLSADPAMQALSLWRVMNPSPFPDEQQNGPRARIEFAEAMEQHLRNDKPDQFSAHPMLAREADEDWFIHQMTFQHIGNFLAGVCTREHLEYLRAQPRLPSYRYVADILRYLQWQDGGRRDRPWVLKTPVHIGCLDELLAVHPGATLVYPRRDFHTVLASFCHALRGALTLDIQISDEEIGALAMDFWSAEMQRFVDTRRRLGDSLNLLEIPYQRLMQDPIAEIRQIHRRAGRQLSAEGERCIRQWIADNPPGKHGKNVYALETYGLTPAMVDRTFGQFESD